MLINTKENKSMSSTIRKEATRMPILLAFLAALFAGAATAEERPSATLYKNPQCSCCEEYANYLRGNGFAVKVVATHDLSLLKKQHGVSQKFEGCHTALINNYVVEGHVPIKSLNKLLAEQPNIKGVSLPGMPQGSPGMTGQKSEPFTIYEIGNGSDLRVSDKD